MSANNKVIDFSERRSAERFDVNKIGTLVVNNANTSIRIVDVSVKGMKIWGHELSTNQQVVIEIKNGTSIHATVVWAIGEAAGLRFRSSIGENHPLMLLAKR